MKPASVVARHSDRDLDAKMIYHPLPTNPEMKQITMYVAERAEVRLERISQGISRGLWVGRIRTLQEFPDLTVSPCEELETLPIEGLKGRRRLDQHFKKVHPASPFGGYKESGFGREGGKGLLIYANPV